MAVSDWPKLDCPLSCAVPAGYTLVETPPSRHAWSDVVRCPNEGCERTFLITSRPEVTDDPA